MLIMKFVDSFQVSPCVFTAADQSQANKIITTVQQILMQM